MCEYSPCVMVSFAVCISDSECGAEEMCYSYYGTVMTPFNNVKYCEIILFLD